jgi:hypothetical protein
MDNLFSDLCVFIRDTFKERVTAPYIDVEVNFQVIRLEK